MLSGMAVDQRGQRCGDLVGGCGHRAFRSDAARQVSLRGDGRLIMAQLGSAAARTRGERRRRLTLKRLLDRRDVDSEL